MQRNITYVLTGELPSKNQLKVVGDRVRKRVTAPQEFELDGEQAEADAALINHWRSLHSSALVKTRSGLGQIVRRLQGRDSQAGLVTQRLKRIESIVGKLVRDKPRLGEIEDIAGCRAVLPDLNKVRDASEQLANARSLTISKLRDYNSLPTLVVTVRYTTGVAGTGSKLKFSFVRRTNRSGLS